MKLHELHQIDEGWKSKLAAGAIAAGTIAGIANSPPITIDGTRYDKAIGSPPASAKTVEYNGKKYKVWSVNHQGPKQAPRKIFLYSAVNEGVLDVFSKKRKEEKADALTPEERKLIKRIFPNCNVDMKMSGDRYVFDSNAHAIHGRANLSFYKKGDELRVSVAHYKSESDAIKPTARPLLHTDHVATEDELERIKRDIS